MPKDKAWQWLRENDPLFADRKSLEYSYLSEQRMRKKRKEKEIPVSSLHDPLTRDRFNIKEHDALTVIKLLD